MDERRLVKIGRFLSKHLRHAPELLGLTLGEGDWVEVEKLLAASAARGFPITRAELEEVVAKNDKRRFSFDASGSLIRANQGHSVAVDLQLEAREPPPILYHGTAERSVEAILREGLKKMRRHHVHLSKDVETARKVGARYGETVILEVAAARMREAGFEFYLSENGVWLVDRVPPQFLKKL